jgi:hypothetical protein
MSKIQKSDEEIDESQGLGSASSIYFNFNLFLL